MGKASETERICPSPSARISALPATMRPMARRSEITRNGAYEALSNRTAMVPPHRQRATLSPERRPSAANSCAARSAGEHATVGRRLLRDHDHAGPPQRILHERVDGGRVRRASVEAGSSGHPDLELFVATRAPGLDRVDH